MKVISRKKGIVVSNNVRRRAPITYFTDCQESLACWRDISDDGALSRMANLFVRVETLVFLDLHFSAADYPAARHVSFARARFDVHGTACLVDRHPLKMGNLSVIFGTRL